MEKLEFGDQVVLFDRLKTQSAYAAIPAGDAERCGCLYCVNFASQRLSAYPPIFESLLAQLGIDFTKESEVYEAGSDGEMRTYGGWFHFSGQVVQSGERSVIHPSGFQYWFVDANRLPPADADFGESVAAVEFLTQLPWPHSGHSSK